MGEPRLSVAQKHRVHAGSVRHAQHRPDVAGDLYAVQDEHDRVVCGAELFQIVPRQLRQRQKSVRLAAFGKFFVRFGGNGVQFRRTRGKFFRQCRRFVRADVFGAEEETVQRGLKFFAQ